MTRSAYTGMVGLTAARLMMPPGSHLSAPGTLFFDQDFPEVLYRISDDGSRFVKVSVDAMALASRAGIMSLNTPRAGAGAFVKANYPRLRSAIQRVISGFGYAKIGFVGDSTQTNAYGLAGSGTTTNTNCRATSHVAYLAAALNSLGIPCCDAAFFGDQNTPNEGGAGAVAGYDPRITLGAAWTDTGSNLKVAGGSALQNGTANDTTALTFKPREFVDTYDIYFATSATTPSFQAMRTGETAVQYVGGTAFALVEGVGKVTYKGTLGPINTLGIQISRLSSAGSGTLYIIGVDAYNSQVPSVRLFNIGWNSGMAANWIDVSRGWSSMNVLKAMQCDAIGWMGAINDWRTAANGGGAGVATPVATYRTELEFAAQQLSPTTDLIFTAGYPTAQSDTDLALQRQYIAQMYSVAKEFGYGVHDMHAKIGSYERGNDFGLYANTIHVLSATQRQRAEAEAGLIAYLGT